MYSFTGTQHDIRKTILTIALLYASEAFSMTILLLVFHGKRDIRITQHAFWTTVIFPVIATVTADILYIKGSGRFFLGLFFLLFAALIYVVAGLGLSMLCTRIFGHSAFRPFTYGRHIPARNGAARHGSIRGNYTGSRAYSDKAYSDKAYSDKAYGDRDNRNREFRDREDQDRASRDRMYEDRDHKEREYKDSRNGFYESSEFKGWGFETQEDNRREGRSFKPKQSNSAADDSRPAGEEKEGPGYFGYHSDKHAAADVRDYSGSSTARSSKQPEQFHKSSVIIPDYTQEYIDKIDRDYVDRLNRQEEDGLSLIHPKDRPVYYGGTKSRALVAYINRDNQLISCDERRTGYGRLGRIASSGEVYEYNGGTEAYAGIVTAAGYIRNASGLDIGCVDEDGNVFRYEGEGALDMTHAKTLVGKVNPGDYSAGAAFLLLLRKEE